MLNYDDYYTIDGVQYKWPDRNYERTDDSGVIEDVDSGLWLILELNNG